MVLGVPGAGRVISGYMIQDTGWGILDLGSEIGNQEIENRNLDLKICNFNINWKLGLRISR